MENSRRKVLLSEDWLITLLGLTLIFLYVAGLSVPGPRYSWNTLADLSEKILTASNFISIVKQFALVIISSSIISYASGKNVRPTLKVVPILFLLSQLALVVAGNAVVKSYNLEAVIFSLIIGLLISQFSKLPDEWRAVLSSESYVKIGLVFLGTSVIFSEILKAGSLGLIQAILVVLSVWYVSYWICKKLKVDNELTFMLSSAVSICGVSAAIATAGAIQGDSKKLSFVISVVLVTAIPMMIGMPYMAQALHLSDEVTGAWLGGTIDTTGAVVAAGSLAGDAALKISTIVKFSQNVLLGLAAFVISLYWTYTKNEKSNKEKPSLAIIWQRFPKFVIGFILASLLFSFVLSPDKVAAVKDDIKSIQTLWFVLAFTSIGLETKFSDIFQLKNQKPLIAFLSAQAFNIIITLLIAWLLF
jgi:uncharacterized integral membrane protein (TIGR00698 family)